MNRFIIAVTAAICATGVARAEVTQDDITNDQTNTSQIVTNGMGQQLQRFSPLDTLNKENVKNLMPAWAFSLGGEKQRGQETQPIIHDGIMYITGSYSAGCMPWTSHTGEEIWQYDARLPEGILPCCDVINRGAALYGDKIYFGTLDARIVALNAKTGDVVWNKKIAEYKEGYSYTAAPLIVNGLVITGNSGGEFGIVGEVQARDAETGDLVWTRPVIEGYMGTLNGEESTMTGTLNATWPGDMWKTGGGATWLGGSYDAETDTLVFGTGNPAPWNSWLRDAGDKNDGSGDNLYAASRLGIDPATGEIKWHFQTTPREGWDYDGVNEVVAFTDTEGNKKYATADRNGYFYVLNREDGKFLNAWPFVKDISWASGIDENGRPIYVEENRPGNPAGAADGGKGEVVFSSPSFLGGKNWMPMAFSQKTGLFYVPSNEWGMDIWNEPITYKKGAAYLGSGFTIKPNYEDHIGSLKAIDPMTGEWKWEYKNDAPLWGGVMTTAGGLVFFGTPEGEFKALDDETGEELWSFQTGSGIVGQPVTWEMDGEQYVSVVSGWGGAVPLWGGEVAKKVNYLNQGGLVWTFKLPKQLAMAN